MGGCHKKLNKCKMNIPPTDGIRLRFMEVNRCHDDNNNWGVHCVCIKCRPKWNMNINGSTIFSTTYSCRSLYLYETSDASSKAQISTVDEQREKEEKCELMFVYYLLYSQTEQVYSLPST